MNQHKSKEFRKQRADELRSLGRILQEENFINDDGPLQTAASGCLTSQGSNWRYSIDGLKLGEVELTEMNVRHARPDAVVKYVVELNIEVTGIYTDETDLIDPFEELSVNIEVFGTSDNGATEETYKQWPYGCAWHLDRQIKQEGDNIAHFVHPIYHFQYGGRKIWDKKGYNYGSHLLLESPRIAHPPLDGILAIDFVLSNYYGDKWNFLRTESDASNRYKDLLREAQRRVWKPYSFATASHWYQPPSLIFASPHSWESHLVWPHLG